MSSGDSEEIEQEQEEEEISQEINTKSIQKVMINKDKDEHNGTFVFFDEDHTLGNSLRFVLVNQPDVDFCGYSLPHPSENKMNLRLQTINQCKEKVMNDGLKTIVSICDIIEAKFKQALNEQN